MLNEIVKLHFYKIIRNLEELIEWSIANSLIEEVAYLTSAKKLVEEAEKHANS